MMSTIDTVISPDTTYTDTTDILESFAPGTGLVHLENDNGVFDLIDHEVE